MTDLIPVLSLLVALLAIFVGPFATWRTERLKLEADRRTAWANEVRAKLAEFLARALHYHVAGFEDRTDAEYLQVTQLQFEIALLLDPRLPGEEALLAACAAVASSLETGKASDHSFASAHDEARRLAQDLLHVERRYLQPEKAIKGPA